MAHVTTSHDKTMARPRRPYKADKWPQQNRDSTPRSKEGVEMGVDPASEEGDRTVTTEETTPEASTEEVEHAQSFADRVSGA